MKQSYREYLETEAMRYGWTKLDVELMDTNELEYIVDYCDEKDESYYDAL